jgi:hypothetical protein
MAKAKLKNGVVTDVFRGSLEITEQSKKFKIKKKKWEVEWDLTSRPLKVGARVSYYEAKADKGNYRFIRDIEKRYDSY